MNWGKLIKPKYCSKKKPTIRQIMIKLLESKDKERKSEDFKINLKIKIDIQQKNGN